MTTILKSLFNNEATLIVLAPGTEQLQRLGCDVVKQLVRRRLSCSLCVAGAEPGVDLLHTGVLLLICDQSDASDQQMEALVRRWQPLLFITGSSAPLAGLDFAVFTLDHHVKQRASHCALDGLRSVLSYFGAREILPVMHGTTLPFASLERWLHNLAGVLPVHPAAAAE